MTCQVLETFSPIIRFVGTLFTMSALWTITKLLQKSTKHTVENVKGNLGRAEFSKN
jgi:hypothetical protein